MVLVDDRVVLYDDPIVLMRDPMDLKEETLVHTGDHSSKGHGPAVPVDGSVVHVCVAFGPEHASACHKE